MPQQTPPSTESSTLSKALGEPWPSLDKVRDDVPYIDPEASGSMWRRKRLESGSIAGGPALHPHPRQKASSSFPTTSPHRFSTLGEFCLR